MNSFNLDINVNTPFKRLAYNPKTFKLTAAFKKFVRDNEGFYEGYDLLKDRGLAFNPKTRRIVERSTLYTKATKNVKSKPRAKLEKAFTDVNIEKIDNVVKKIGNKATLNLSKTSEENIKKIIQKIPLNLTFLITVKKVDGSVFHYTLNEQTYDNLLNILSSVETEATTQGSDSQLVEIINKAKYFTIKQIDPSKKAQGAFFPYTLNISLPNVEKFGIFEKVLDYNYKETCFIQALRCSKMVSKETIESIKFNVRNSYLPMCKIKEICENHKLHIVVRGLTNTKNTRRYGNKELPQINIGLIEQHYFFIEKTEITKYAIKNYDLLQSRKLSKPWYHYVKPNEANQKRGMDTLALFKLLLNDQSVKQKFLQPIKISSQLMATPYHQKINEFPELGLQFVYYPVVDHEARKQKIEKKQFHQQHTTRVWFDFETTTDGKKHVPYLCCYVDDNNNKRTFYGVDCGKKMLNDLHKKYFEKHVKGTPKKSVTMFAHNLTYDFITGIAQYVHVSSTIEKGSRVMMAEGSFYGLSLKMQDSYALITAPLSKFGKMFQLDQEKEVMPYDVYTENRMTESRPLVHIDECLKCLKESEQNQFIENCEKWKCLKNDQVDIVKYSAIYCMADCDVLKKGYLKFGSMIKDVCDLDVDHYISNASIADDFLISRGCYDDCVQVQGITRAFIQKCLVGGRTMCANNEKQKQTSKGTKISDFDAVSLYPSAMKRLKGFLRGSPRLVDILTDYEYLKEYASGFYVRVKITKVNKKRAFPLLSYINKEGTRIFSNDMVGRIVFIDNVALEDAITYHGVEFEIVDGYYFDEGFNTKIKDVIEEVFQARIQKKKENNPMEQIYKLIMNSSYGKTCLKEVNEKHDYVPNDKFEKFMSRNYNWIKKAVQCENGNGYRITSTNPVFDHHNRAHIGIQILSMSKRIMNEVMTTAEDNQLPIYYQDTDSMHMHLQDVPKLQKAFNKKFKRELIGKGMGQFHSDFELDGCRDVYSEKFIALGKKCYVDCLVGIDTETGEEKKGHHIRLKGVPNGAIMGYAKNNNKTPLQIYQELHRGKAITFDLLQDEHGKKIRFKKGDNMVFSTVNEFTRKIQFKK